MGWKCALQVKGLTLGEPKKSARHKMNLRKACMEAGYERASKSDTLDRMRSGLNKYIGYKKGAECADVMESEAEFVTVRMKDGTLRQRRNRSDAVPGFALICNPPAAMCRDWDDEAYRKFYQDSWECLCAYYPRIFRDENVCMRVEHWDEGVPPENNSDLSEIDRHEHVIGYARTSDGAWCGNEIDAKFFIGLNKVFPSMMRERGWDIEDLDTTDYSRAAVDPDYAMERKVKRQMHGRSVNQHLHDKTKQMVDEASDMLNAAVTMKEAAVQEVQELQEETMGLQSDIDFLQSEKEDLESGIEALNSQKQSLEAQTSKLDGVIAVKKEETEQLNIAIEMQYEQLADVDAKTKRLQSKEDSLNNLRAKVFRFGYNFLEKIGWRLKKEQYTEEELLEELEKATRETRILKEQITTITDRVFSRIRQKLTGGIELQNLELGKKWDIIEADFQAREDALEAQKAIIEAQKEVFSPAGAAHFILDKLKFRYQSMQRTEMVNSIAILNRKISDNASFLNMLFFENVYCCRKKRDILRLAPSDDLLCMEKGKSSEWQYGD